MKNKKTKGWQKGGIIGLLIGVIFAIMGTISTTNSGLGGFCAFMNCVGAKFYLVVIISFITFFTLLGLPLFLVGALIGLLVYKTKTKKK